LSGEILPLDSLRGKRICAFAGIARPEAFRQSLTALGGEVAAFTPFTDHHVYTGPDRDAIDGAAGKAGAELIVTTEKDAVKLASSFAFAGACWRFGSLWRLTAAPSILPDSSWTR
jgi:tetraacyldisaccharide 4'-kinase